MHPEGIEEYSRWASPPVSVWSGQPADEAVRVPADGPSALPEDLGDKMERRRPRLQVRGPLARIAVLCTAAGGASPPVEEQAE